MTPATAPALDRWLRRRLPAGWFVEAPEVRADRDEILVIGRLREPAVGPEAHHAACAARIAAFREDTREQRVAIAQAAQRQFDRPLSWGAVCGDVRTLFTTLTIPTMTRLRLAERNVLDTLIAGGVARSRSDALAWCVRLVGANEGEWLRDLREAFAQVERVRTAGPTAPPGD